MTLSKMDLIVTRSITILGVSIECHGECHNAECRYAECRGSEFSIDNWYLYYD
jgi:hypothetical protein